MTALDLDAIEQRADAASRGPWEWRGDARFHTIELSNWLPGMGRCAILRPRRAGMQSATFEFAVEDWRMKRAEELAVYEVAPEATRADDPRVYRHDIIGIRHPDAEFIAHAREDVPALVAAIRAALALHPKVSIPIVGVPGRTHRDLCGLCRDGWPCATVAALS